MSGHIEDARLSDYVEDLLDAGARRKVERHLDGCASCTERVESTRGLLEGLAELPSGISPERDLYAEIATRIDELGAREEAEGSRAGQGAGRWRLLWAQRYPLATAALLLVILTTAVNTALIGRKVIPETTPTGTPGSPAGATAIQAYRAIERDYAAAIEARLVELRAIQDRLDSESRRAIEENLRVIDDALRETIEALLRDPANETLRRFAVAGYEKKLDLLRRATEIMGET